MEILANTKPRRGASLPEFRGRFPIRKLTPDFHPDYLCEMARKLQLKDSLWTQGEILPGDRRAVAIVGSRVCHPDTNQKAYDLAFALARRGVRIVSGLDFGVDEAAHKGAVEAVGRTLMVLPNGLERIRPRAHKKFYQTTIECGSGAGLSPFSPGLTKRPDKQSYIKRNRLIASLSQALIVVETKKKSDTMSCALVALTRGRPVGFLSHMMERSSVRNLFARNLLGHLLFVVRRPEDVLEKLTKD